MENFDIKSTIPKDDLGYEMVCIDGHTLHVIVPGALDLIKSNNKLMPIEPNKEFRDKLLNYYVKFITELNELNYDATNIIFKHYDCYENNIMIDRLLSVFFNQARRKLNNIPNNKFKIELYYFNSYIYEDYVLNNLIDNYIAYLIIDCANIFEGYDNRLYLGYLCETETTEIRFSTSMLQYCKLFDVCTNTDEFEIRETGITRKIVPYNAIFDNYFNFKTIFNANYSTIEFFPVLDIFNSNSNANIIVKLNITFEFIKNYINHNDYTNEITLETQKYIMCALFKALFFDVDLKTKRNLKDFDGFVDTINEMYYASVNMDLIK
jgi:hypothetical protein